MASANYCCEYCNKIYVRKSSFNNHLLNCKLSRVCKTNEVSTCNEENVNIQTMNINIHSIYKLLINLTNKYDKLETQYNELKKYCNLTKKKISIIDYLNQHFTSVCDSFDFIDFTSTIDIELPELELIFKKDYVEGVYEIIVNTIEKMKENDPNICIPIKSFSQKDGVIYIYVKTLNEKWIVMNDESLNILIKYFDKKLLRLFLEWKVKNELIMDSDIFGEVYIKNMKRVVGGNYNNKNKKIMIKNKLYKYLKVNLKNVVSYEFI